MDKEIERRINKIEEAIKSFSISWVSTSLTDLGYKGEEKPFHNIFEPGVDLINRGGKRWRPLLMVLFCELSGGGETAYPFTPVVEIAHNGTLIVDDIEDNSEMRRGDLAVHLKFGTDMAINTGNFMCFLPSLIIEKSSICNDKKRLLFQYFLEDLRNLHIGQGLDIQWHNHYDYIPNLEEYFLMCSLKTGTLARMAARMGIILGGGDEECAAFVGQQCEKFGVAFQIIDDVKNLTTGNPGKNPGDDIIEGKKSLPLILSLQEEPNIKLRIIEIFKELSSKEITFNETGAQKLVREAIDLIAQTGSLKKAKEIALSMINEASDNLRKRFSDAPQLDILFKLFTDLS